MRLTSVKPNDIVLVNVKGRHFLAMVSEVESGGLVVEPILSGISYRHVSAREVIAHWSKRRVRGET